MKKLNLVMSILNDYLKYGNKEWHCLEQKIRPLELELLRIFRSSNSMSDEEAAKLLFNTDFKNQNYQRHRRNLLEKLTSEILLFCPNGKNLTSYQQSYYKCEKLYSILRLLRNSPYNEFTKSVASQLYTKSRKYHFSEMRIAANQYLLTYYSTLKLNANRALKHENDLAISIKEYNAEIEAITCTDKLMALILSGKVKKDELNFIGQRLIEKLEIHKSKGILSPNFYRKYFLIQAYLYESNGNYDKAVTIARTGYNYFLDLPFDHRKAKVALLLTLSNSYIRTGYLTEAKQVLTETLNLQSDKQKNWLMSLWLIVQIDLIQQNYEDALIRFEELLGSMSFNRASAEDKQMVHVCEAYFHLLIKLKKASLHSSNKTKIKFGVKKIPEFDVAKKRTNIPILVVLILSHCLNSEYKKLNETIVELSKYGKRSFHKDNPEFRTYCFIHLVSYLVAENFHPIAVKRKSATYLEKLLSSQIKISEQKQILELIPYEHLWEIIIGNLKTPKRKVDYSNVPVTSHS